MYAPKAEVPWIENIDTQFMERPIPNFYKLLSESVHVDVPVEDGMILELEDEITIRCVESAGHSIRSKSYMIKKDLK